MPEFDPEASRLEWRRRSFATMQFLDAFIILPVVLSAAWGIVQWRNAALLLFGLAGAVAVTYVYLTQRKRLVTMLRETRKPGDEA